MNCIEQEVKEDIRQELTENLPAIILRNEADKYSYGIFSKKSLANLDAKKEGIAIRIKVGREVAYPKTAFIDFLLERMRVSSGD